MMNWSRWSSCPHDVLADLYPTLDEAKKMATTVGLRPGRIHMEGSSDIRWFNILKHIANSWAKKPGLPPRALALVDLALKDFPDHDVLAALRKEEPPLVEAPRVHLVMPSAGEGEHYDKIAGAQDTLLPIRSLEIGTQRARAVARIVRGDGTSGTGFLIGNGWLLTNNHVLPTREVAASAVAEFNYQQNADGPDGATQRFQLDAARFHTSPANDWTVVGIDTAAEGTWGTIPLQPGEVAVDAFVNIIQHPGGGPKHIGLHHNIVAAIREGRIQYVTDGLPGSSGAPVFDSAWNMVALHHSGGLRVPGTKKRAYVNEGIAVGTVIEDLRTAGVL
jgi:V8-like Glu-specific endopeptidase